MGTAFSTLPLNETDAISGSSPNRADWLTNHADATGLAVVEVERLWNRFKQLTGSNDQTRLYPDNTTFSNELSSDVFVKNLLKHFPRAKSDLKAIPFGYFITVIQWFESASIQDKLHAIFFYLNNGDPIDANMLSKLLKHLYPETREEEIKALSVRCMQQLGSNEQGKLNEKQFVNGVQRCVPPNELEEMLSFSIIPGSILDEANMLPSLQSSSINIRTHPGHGMHDTITDDQLRQIAGRSATRQWAKLALALGFLEYDIEAYRTRNHNDPAATMYELLRMWREQEASVATQARLEQCLRKSGFEDLVPILH